ncbi:MAG: serine hydrolase domain-containing protein [Candidatus Hydrogenedentota bacterium]
MMMRWILIAVFMVGATNAFANGEVPTASPKAVGMSADRLENMSRNLDMLVETEQIAGSVTLVSRHGKVVYFRENGFQYKEEDVPMSKDTIFRIASMTKPITSVALMMLFEEGAFLLDDPISNWLPEYANPMVAIKAPDNERVASPYKLVPANKAITVRHVLTHTAGLANSYRGMTRELLREANADFERTTVEAAIRRQGSVPLNFHPGEAWEYGGATSICGVLVELISGMTLDEFFKVRIFEPLGMTDTYFNIPEEKVSRQTALYNPTDDGTIALTRAAEYVEPHEYFSGAGGLASTASDYWKFCQMLLNGGEFNGTRLLSRRTIDLMISNHVGDHAGWLMGDGYQFGLGFRILSDPGHAYEHLSLGSFGWGGAYNTYFFIDPVEDMIGISMIQIRPYTQLKTRSHLGIFATQAIVDDGAGVTPKISSLGTLGDPKGQ